MHVTQQGGTERTLHRGTHMCLAQKKQKVGYLSLLCLNSRTSYVPTTYSNVGLRYTKQAGAFSLGYPKKRRHCLRHNASGQDLVSLCEGKRRHPPFLQKALKILFKFLLISYKVFSVFSHIRQNGGSYHLLVCKVGRKTLTRFVPFLYNQNPFPKAITARQPSRTDNYGFIWVHFWVSP